MMTACRCLQVKGGHSPGEVPRAHQAGQFERIAAVGVDPIAGRFGDERGRDNPADRTFLGQRAIEPIPARASCRDKDELLTLGLQLTDECITVPWAGPNVAAGDDLSGVFFGALGDRKRVFMDLQTDGEWARLLHG
jgi:hypothetical protein